MAEEPSLSYYLAGGRITGFIPFPRVLVLCEMQSVSSRIWTRVTVSISYGYNHYTTGTSNPITNNNDGCASPRKLLPWIFVSANIFSPAVFSTRQFFHGFLNWLYKFPIGLVGRELANGPGDRSSISRRVIQKTLEWYLILLGLILSIIRYVSKVMLSILSSLVRSIPKHNMLVIGGDMNAQIGKNGNNKYSLHNTSNRNGQHLTDFMIENRLACLNTNYQKREGKLWTYTYANNTKAQIDYVLIK